MQVRNACCCALEGLATIVPTRTKHAQIALAWCRAKQEFGTDKVGYTFIFGEEAQPFLKSLAVSGSDFTFVGTSAILPADQNAVTVPNSQFSATGFVSADGSATTALVNTQVIHLAPTPAFLYSSDHQ